MAPVPGREWRSGRTQSVRAFGSWYVGHLSLLIQTTCYNVSPFSYHVSFQLIMSPTVPVGGPVTIRSDIHLGENYAVIAVAFYCQAAKGTHPQYQWFLNKTLLHDNGSFYNMYHYPPRQSLLMLSVGRDSAGTYHCEVSDNFDNTTAISSKRHYVDKEGTVDPLLYSICLDLELKSLS